MPRRPLPLLVFSVALAAVACRDEPAGPRPPEPPTEGVERAVAKRLAEATADVRARAGAADAWGRLGEVYDVNSLEDPAMTCYARASALDPHAWRWPYFQALALRSSAPDEALALFERAAAIEPAYPALRFHLGMAHYLAEDLDAAELEFGAALAGDASCIDAAIGLARVAIARGQPDDALRELERAAELAPAEGAVHLHLAQVYRELGRHADAEREERLTFGSTSRALPDGFARLADPVREEAKRRECVSAKRWLAEARQEMLAGRRDAAAEMLELALASEPDSSAVLIVSARLLVEQGRIEAARERFERAVEVDPSNGEARTELAAVLVMTGDQEAAIQALEQALAVDPGLPGAQVKLAGLLLQAGRGERALALLREAAREQPEDTEVRERLTQVLVQLDRHEEALAGLGDFANGLAAHGEIARARQALRMALELAARSQRAITDPERLRRLDEAAREMRTARARLDSASPARGG